MPRQIAGIVNPGAGRGRAMAVWRRTLLRLPASMALSAGTYVTRTPGDGAALARQAVQDGYDIIAAVGGDGTVHEVVNGLIDRGAMPGDTALAVVPAGTGMDFARNMRMARGSRAAAERIRRGDIRTIDVGMSLHPRPKIFVNFAETGLGAAVVAREREMEGNLPGRMSFLVAALSAISTAANIEGTIRIDGQDVYQGRLVSAVVANGRYLGGGMKIAPFASCEDGFFDVLILGDFTRAELLTQIWKVYPGTHLSHHKVLWSRGRQVDVSVPASTPLDLDGELAVSSRHEFVLQPAVLRVLV